MSFCTAVEVLQPGTEGWDGGKGIWIAHGGILIYDPARQESFNFSEQL